MVEMKIEIVREFETKINKIGRRRAIRKKE